VDLSREIQDAHDRIMSAAPSGFIMAFFCRFASPNYMWKNFPQSWMDIYSGEGLHLVDPIVYWGIRSRGVLHWSSVRIDPGKVMQRAAAHGLSHGVSIVLATKGGPTLASFARPDRDFREAEVESLRREMNFVLNLVGEEGRVTDAGRRAMECWTNRGGQAKPPKHK